MTLQQFLHCTDLRQLLEVLKIRRIDKYLPKTSQLTWNIIDDESGGSWEASGETTYKNKDHDILHIEEDCFVSSPLDELRVTDHSNEVLFKKNYFETLLERSLGFTLKSHTKYLKYFQFFLIFQSIEQKKFLTGFMIEWNHQEGIALYRFSKNQEGNRTADTQPKDIRNQQSMASHWEKSFECKFISSRK